VTVIEVLVCCGIPNFIKIGSPPEAHNCSISNAHLLDNGHCHVATSWRKCCERHWMRQPKFRLSQSTGRWGMAFPTFSKLAAVCHF